MHLSPAQVSWQREGFDNFLLSNFYGSELLYPMQYMVVLPTSSDLRAHMEDLKE